MSFILRPSIGDKVGCIQSITEDGAVNFFGWGHYMGDIMPPPGIIVTLPGCNDPDPPPPDKYTKISGGINAMAFARGLEPRRLRRKVPRISLFDGTTIWGCECWWGSVKDIEKVLEDRKVNHVSIEDYRGRAPGVRRTEDLAGDLRIFLNWVDQYKKSCAAAESSAIVQESPEQREVRLEVERAAFKPLRTARKRKLRVKKIRRGRLKRDDCATIKALQEDLRALGGEVPIRAARFLDGKSLRSPRNRRWKRSKSRISIGWAGTGAMRRWLK